MTDEERIKAKQNYKDFLEKKADKGELKTQANILVLVGLLSKEEYAERVKQATTVLIEDAVDNASDKDLELFKSDIVNALLGAL